MREGRSIYGRPFFYCGVRKFECGSKGNSDCEMLNVEVFIFIPRSTFRNAHSH